MNWQLNKIDVYLIRLCPRFHSPSYVSNWMTTTSFKIHVHKRYPLWYNLNIMLSQFFKANNPTKVTICNILLFFTPNMYSTFVQIILKNRSCNFHFFSCSFLPAGRYFYSSNSNIPLSRRDIHEQKHTTFEHSRRQISPEQTTIAKHRSNDDRHLHNNTIQGDQESIRDYINGRSPSIRDYFLWRKYALALNVHLNGGLRPIQGRLPNLCWSEFNYHLLLLVIISCVIGHSFLVTLLAARWRSSWWLKIEVSFTVWWPCFVAWL